MEEAAQPLFVRLLQSLRTQQQTAPSAAEDGVAGLSPQQEHRDRLHLRLLAVGFYIVAVTGAVFSFTLIPGALIMGFFVLMPLQADAETEFTLAQLPMVTAVIFGLLLAMICIERLAFLTSQSITTRRRLAFVRRMAWCVMALPPVGPLLGVAALWVLARPTVAARFDRPQE